MKRSSTRVSARAFWHTGLWAMLAVGVLGVAPARAQVLLRDAEIEFALQMVAEPIMRSSSIELGAVQLLVVGDSTLNAFVVDGQHIMIHSGLIMRLGEPDELQGVIAHELGHIVNGHIARRSINLQSASVGARLGMILALAAAAVSPEAGVGIAAGTANSAMRRFLTHTRAEESAADLSAARTMARAGISPEAMIRVLEIFRGQEVLSDGLQDPYVLSHPLSRDRIRALKGQAAAFEGESHTSETTRYWFQRMRTKLSAFLRNPAWTLRRIERSDHSELATLARAIAYHRMPDPAKARHYVDALIAMRPNDAYYHELKGQILLESARPREAVAAYRRAAALKPREALIMAGLGRAQLAAGDDDDALATLRKARARDPNDAGMLRNLALAYARNGNNGMASVATAERYALMGQFETAAIHAERAAGLVPRGSPGWFRAQDILDAAKAAK